uniref:Uncharacterized protein n=1 Tax=Glossina palpalis gambiensis TaxID=67801 RepID=A0A1B0BPG2_9MUSC
MVDAVFSGILLGTTGYAMVSVSPIERPYAYTACTVGFCHALAGLVKSLVSKKNFTKRIKRLTCSCLEIMTVPLINIELYLKSEQSSPLALGHGLFIVPLAFDVITKVAPNEEGDEIATQTLKDLTILGNIISLLFLAANENISVYGLMALAAFTAKYGAILMDNLLTSTGEGTSLIAYAILLGLVPMALRSGSVDLPAQ